MRHPLYKENANSTHQGNVAKCRNLVTNAAYLITGFRRGENDIFALLECYAAYIGSYPHFGTTYRPRIQGSSFILVYGTDKLSRNVGNQHPITAKI